ncbi:MAG: ftsI [Bacteroidetes bacterium]|nr:ftsI [Bacteroidota bacterium]
MAVRDEIVWRSGVVYIALTFFAVAIVIQILILQYVQRGRWTAMSEKYVFKTAEMPANRGDILAHDGRLLASSVPYYSIYMDTRSTGMSADTWSRGINGLCDGLSHLLGVRSPAGWKSVITNARKKGDRYFLIQKKVDYATLKKLKELPIFREGQYKGGLVAQPENRRILPHSELAARTIGYLNLGTEGTRVGLEGSFNKDLAGKTGMAVKQRLIGGDWIIVDDGESVESKNGNDIVTTIDVDLQDVASSALENQLRKHNAHHGCAVLMEVETGDIRAIANLEQSSDAMRLNQQLDLQIKGEGKPLIRYPGDKYWSGLSLPMMSHGYEVQMTPLQILTFYNAVANDGKMMRPRFVTEILRNGSVVKSFGTDVIINSIASRSTIRKAKEMMEGVVEHGTATNLRNANYKIAGKTGTAQIARDKRGYRQGPMSYQASFVGYFPAENPLYSCIVVVNAPSNGVYYGNIVAGSVFKEISDKVYATTFYRDYRAENKDDNKDIKITAPEAGNGYRADINEVLGDLKVRYKRTSKEDWVATRESGDTIRLVGVGLKKGLVPDVRGMSLRDAIYLLENSGLKVRYNGKGRVLRQSPEHGARIYEGSVVSLDMNM